MGQELPSGFRKFAIIVLAVGAAAAALNLVFARVLDAEPLGLLGFGLFCLGCATLVISRSKMAGAPAHATQTSRNKAAVEFRMADGDVVHALQAAEKNTRSCHALTIDLEDYFHTEVAAQGVSPRDWANQPARIEASTHQLLDLLEANNTRATFFVLGWVASRFPWLVREIHHRGHEIGCHSLEHQLVCRMSPQEFFRTTRIAQDLIESLIGERIEGYRAPCFSIVPGAEWAFEALAELGFRYDSSVHPVQHPLYGNANAPRRAYRVANGRLAELPIATWRLAGHNLSVGGGAYLRLLPYQYIRRGLAAWEKETRMPAMIYLHPWEIDPYQPYIPLSRASTVRQTWGTATMGDKLQRLIRQFQFAPAREAYSSFLAGRVEVQSAIRGAQRMEQIEQVAG